VRARAICLDDLRVRDACVRMLVVGGAAAAALGLHRVARALLGAVDPWAVLHELRMGLRLPGHVADTNAAGSGFVLAGLLALALLIANGRHRIVWAVTLAVIGSGFRLRLALGASARCSSSSSPSPPSRCCDARTGR
jgi:hypothetical protein